MNKKLTLSLVLALMLTAISTTSWSIGVLLPTDQQIPPLAIKTHRVTVDLNDRVAKTHVEQVFVNHTSRQLEATFLFPIPEGSSVSEFILYINGQPTKGVILEASAARSQYEAIVRRMVDPGLVEYMDGKLFSARIFPVPANGEQKVEITFTGLVEEEAGIRKYIYPMRTGRTHAKTIEDLTITANVHSTTELNAVYSPTHKIASRKLDDHQARAGLEITGGDLEQDFLLYITTSESPLGMNLITYDEDGPGGSDPYFMLILSPKVKVDKNAVQHKAITLVMDTSGSMAGDKMQQARETLSFLVNQVGSEDYFNIIRFSSDVEPLFRSPEKASPGNKEKALSFVKQMEAVGGTAIEEALITALGANIPDGIPHYILFVTDGRPTIGTTDYKQLTAKVLKKNNRNTRIFTFGVGFDLNPQILDKISLDNHGVSDFIRPDEELETKVSSFYSKVAYPALSNVTLDMGRIRAYDVYPRSLPDLYRGEQLVVMGRFREQGDTLVRLTGSVNGSSRNFDYEPNFSKQGKDASSEDNDFIGILWANRKVGFLLEEIRLNGENNELKQETIRLAKKFGIVTPYTSYLAIDDREFVQSRPQPIFEPEMERGDMLAPMEKAESRKRNESKMVMDEEVYMEAKSGEEAVTVSTFNKDLKQRQNLGMDIDRSRRVGNKTMNFGNGYWKEEGISSSNKKIEVVYGSDAYFELVVRRPDLAKFLALGTHIEIDAGQGYTLIIGDSGIKDSNAPPLKALY